MNAPRTRTILAVFSLALAACGTPHVDSVSQRNALELKADSLAMLVRANDPPDAYVAEIGELAARLDEAFAYERTKAANASVTKSWRAIVDPKGDLVGAFLAKWQSRGAGLSQGELNAFGARIGAAFDRLSDE